MTEVLETYYGLPRRVVYCKKCVISNQRPSSTPEFKHVADHKHKTMHIGEDGICDACKYAEQKEKINWDDREEELLKLLDKHRRNDGHYDCIVPGSGGKDSVYAAHVLKYKYGMHPLTVTWPPMIYTDIGWKNFRNWISVGGFDNISFNYNGRVHALITRLAIERMFYPMQTIALGQKNIATQFALRFKVPLVFYGENEAEYGNPMSDNSSSLRSKSYHSIKDLSKVWLGGVSVQELYSKYNLTENDIKIYLPLSHDELEKSNIEVRYLGYYLKWTPQEAYYYSVEHAGFQANPVRTEGTYSKYNSLDDRIDGFHYYTTYIKFGLGRATYDASQEIRNKHITREEGIALVRRFDGEFPEKYFNEIMDYIGMDPEYFHELCDKFRSPHLWKKENGEWKLRHPIY